MVRLRSPKMIDDVVLELLHDTTTAVLAAVDGLTDWGPSGARPDQYHSDVVADEAALAVLERGGVGVLSEESGARHTDREVVVVIDPIDGSTNASRSLPWYSTSLCAVDRDGPRAAVVADHPAGVRYEAVRGGGARRDGEPIGPSGCRTVGEAIVGLSDLPGSNFGWDQFRAFGGIALDLCAVADGRLDAYVDCGVNAHGPWDYLGGMLVCQEAGGVVVDALDRDLVALGHDDRRTPVAGATPELVDQLLTARAASTRP